MNRLGGLVGGALLLFSGPCSGADLFYLTNTVVHTNYGPFEYLHGEKITIGGQTLEIRRVLSEDERLTYRLQKIIVPEIDFRGAKLADVVAFLERAAVEFEERQDDGTNTIRFILSERRDGEVPVGDRGSNVLDKGTARYVSLHTAVRYLCRLANLHFKIENGAVVFTEKRTEGGQQPPERDSAPAAR